MAEETGGKIEIRLTLDMGDQERSGMYCSCCQENRWIPLAIVPPESPQAWDLGDYRVYLTCTFCGQEASIDLDTLIALSHPNVDLVMFV